MPHRTAGCGKSSLRPLMAGSSPSLPDGSNPSAAIVQSASDVQCSRLLKTTIAIEAAYFYSPEASAKVRDCLREAQEMNGQIGHLARELAELMRRRRELCEAESIHGSEIFSLPQVVDLAGEQNGRYRSYLKSSLDALAGQFDGKYWPALEDLVDIIAEDAFATDVHFHDQVTQAALGSPKRSKLDYLRGFWAALEESTGCSYAGCLPRGFRLTDSMTAALLNSCYGEELFEATSVKRARQENRQRRTGESRT